MRILLTVLLILFCVSCWNGDKQKYVTVSILPQKYFIERIAGDYIKVNVMIPPGMNPATCDLNMRQLKNLYNSDICFSMGNLPFETIHLYPILESQHHICHIKHSTNIKPIEGNCNHAEHHHNYPNIDPHIWMSPKNVKIIVKQIYDALVLTYPEKKEFFSKNYDKFIQEIQYIDENAAKFFTYKEKKSFLIYHPALTYFANDYGLEQISIEKEGKEPSPQYLQKIINISKEQNIHIIFIQSQFESSNAESIAKAIDGQIFPIDPLTNNWISEMNDIINILNDNLK